MFRISLGNNSYHTGNKVSIIYLKMMVQDTCIKNENVIPRVT